MRLRRRWPSQRQLRCRSLCCVGLIEDLSIEVSVNRRPSLGNSRMFRDSPMKFPSAILRACLPRPPSCEIVEINFKIAGSILPLLFLELIFESFEFGQFFLRRLKKALSRRLCRLDVFRHVCNPQSWTSCV